MRSIWALTGGIAAAVILSACGSEQSPTGPSTDSNEPPGLEVAQPNESGALLARLDGSVRDGTTPMDLTVVQVLHVPDMEDRGIIEFDISSISAPVESAKLNLRVYASTGPYPFTVNVYWYLGDGLLTTSDWGSGALLTTFSYAGQASVTLDVTPALRALVASGARFAGFNFRFAVPSPIPLNGPFVAFHSNEYGPPAVLQFTAARSGDHWITQPDLEPGRYGLATAAVTNAVGQSVVYAIAGSSVVDNSVSRTVKAYNVATKRWTWQAPLPIGLTASNGAGAINGKIYISGGLLNSRRARRDLYMYDRKTTAWTKKTYMPGPGYSGVTGVINGQLYVLTGCYGHGICDPFVGWAFYRYNPVTDRWTTLGTPNTGHREAMGGVIRGKFYVVGGSHSRQLDVYDPATGKWTIKASMPEERHLAAAAVMGGKLYVIGGVRSTPEGHEETVATTYAYDPARDIWTTEAPMPTPRDQISASRIVVDGQERIEVVGHVSPGNNLQFIP
jgi:N-acetylneuraminic acid mutarotase